MHLQTNDDSKTQIKTRDGKKRLSKIQKRYSNVFWNFETSGSTAHLVTGKTKSQLTHNPETGSNLQMHWMKNRRHEDVKKKQDSERGPRRHPPLIRRRQLDSEVAETKVSSDDHTITRRHQNSSTQVIDSRRQEDADVGRKSKFLESEKAVKRLQ